MPPRTHGVWSPGGIPVWLKKSGENVGAVGWSGQVAVFRLREVSLGMSRRWI
jgi:uncharacterized protein GlcG (DUF336 family)